MNILGISLSPRKYGNSECYLKYILTSFDSKKDKRYFLRLTEFDIKPCNACSAMNCLHGNECGIKDDLKIIIDNLINSDILILGSPTYVLNSYPYFYNLYSRIFEIGRTLPFKSGKYAAFFTIDGDNNYIGHNNYSAIVSFLTSLGYNIVYTERLANIRFRGEILLNNKIEQMANEFAHNVILNCNATKKRPVSTFNQKYDNDFNCCKFCGSSSFIIYKSGEVKCTGCLNKGRLDSFNINFNNTIYYTKEEREKHLRDPLNAAKISKDKFINLLSKRKIIRSKSKSIDYIKKRDS